MAGLIARMGVVRYISKILVGNFKERELMIHRHRWTVKKKKVK
jgi:hypothetical protein